MFQMNKVLSKHIWPTEDIDATQIYSFVKRRPPKKGREEALDEPKQKQKKQKGAGSGFLAPVRLLDAFVKFFGIGENALPRADVIKHIWQYIKENELQAFDSVLVSLQDPSDKKTIICDERLKELFQVDSFHGFTVTKLLTAHFIKKEPFNQIEEDCGRLTVKCNYDESAVYKNST
ncbi:upstream activation factor subunit spp27-like [Lycium barbarum]|uniref:upstream activation factor subunit spp27-like n=1 Tax=Lycium barbarum TaxID=112863 RepID=UPI00293E2306|nr:upstream activation factor subunit spp27-like [Lycium barbarum]